MKTLTIIALFGYLSFSSAAFAQPRTLIKQQLTVEVKETKCNANPFVWEIPFETSQLTISYLNSQNRVIFERDFFVHGGNKIRLRARKDNEN